MEGKEMTPQICAAAIELFARKGYNEVSVNEICKAVSITKPTFYKYVKTKEDLLLQYYRSVPGIVGGVWKDCDDPDVLKAISSGFGLCLKHYTSLGTDLMARVMAQQISSSSMPFQCSPEWNRKMVSLIAEGQKTGQIQAAVRPSCLLEVLKAYVLGFCFSLCSQEQQDLREAAGCCIEILKFICQAEQRPGGDAL